MILDGMYRAPGPGSWDRNLIRTPQKEPGSLRPPGEKGEARLPEPAPGAGKGRGRARGGRQAEQASRPQPRAAATSWGTSKRRARKKQAKAKVEAEAEAEAKGEAEAEANEGGTSTPEPGESRGEASKDPRPTAAEHTSWNTSQGGRRRTARAAGAACEAARVVTPVGREE